VRLPWQREPCQRSHVWVLRGRRSQHLTAPDVPTPLSPPLLTTVRGHVPVMCAPRQCQVLPRLSQAAPHPEPALPFTHITYYTGFSRSISKQNSLIMSGNISWPSQMQQLRFRWFLLRSTTPPLLLFIQLPKHFQFFSFVFFIFIQHYNNSRTTRTQVSFNFVWPPTKFPDSHITKFPDYHITFQVSGNCVCIIMYNT